MLTAFSAALGAALAASVALVLALIIQWTVLAGRAVIVAFSSVWALMELVALSAHVLTYVVANSTDRFVSLSAAAAAVWATLGLALAVAALVLLTNDSYAGLGLLMIYFGQIAALIAASPAWCAFVLAARARSFALGGRSAEAIPQ